MMVSNDLNSYAAVSPRPDAVLFDTETGAHQQGTPYQAQGDTPPVVSSKVVTEPDGSTVMQYTSMSHGGTVMRKNVTLHRADAFTADPLNPMPMLRRRSDAYENMMQIF